MKNPNGSFSTFLLWVGPVGENLVLYILKTYNFLQPLALSRPDAPTTAVVLFF